jgi:hypothetical protein
MLQYRDFVPKMTKPAAFLSPAEHESFDATLVLANRWIKENEIRVVNVETVVLPNIWSRYEEGTRDASLGTSGESPSFWHQFIRVWYEVGTLGQETGVRSQGAGVSKESQQRGS